MVGPANPNVLQPVPIVPDQAVKAIGEVKAIAGKANQFGLSEMRKADSKALLADGDPAQNKEPGILKKEGWQDDAKTRDYLDNAKRYAQERAERGIAEIGAKLGLNDQQLAGTSFDDLVKKAGENGWVVNTQSTDSAVRQKAEETLDHLRNAYELAVEKQPLSTQNAGPDVAKVAAQGIDTAAANDPNDQARSALMIIAEGMGRKLNRETGRLQIGISLEGLNAQSLEMQKSTNILDQATGFDLGIAILQYQLVGLNTYDAKIPQNRPDIKKQIEAQRSALNQEKSRLQATREVLKNPDGSEIESLHKTISGIATTDQEKNEAENNPIGFMEAKINQAARNPQMLNSLFSSLGLDGTEATDLMNLAKGIKDDESKQGLEKWIGRGKKAGILAIILTVLMAWLGSRGNQRQQG